jgi:hypothetical protein
MAAADPATSAGSDVAVSAVANTTVSADGEMAGISLV